MILDSSAIIAIITDEAAATALKAKLLSAPVAMVGAPTLFESLMVAKRVFGASGKLTFGEKIGLEVIAFTAEHVEIAHSAFLRFGAGRYGLNYGDCMAYATAKISGLPLLFTGDDFAKTDVEVA